MAQGEEPADDDQSETREVLGGGGGQDDSEDGGDEEDRTASERAQPAAARRGRRVAARANTLALSSHAGEKKPCKLMARRWLADKAHQRDIAMLVQQEVRWSLESYLISTMRVKTPLGLSLSEVAGVPGSA